MGTIGELERKAGIGQTRQERFDFWIRFRHVDGFEVIKAGVTELKRIIQEQERKEQARLRRAKRAIKPIAPQS